MATVLDTAFRERLLDRRRRLQHFARGGEQPYLHELLLDVDAALARLEGGSFGVCEVCNDSVEADRLMADPLCRLCLDHQPPEQLRALEHDLEMARRIQAALLPAPELAFDGWEAYTRYVPAGPVSGDFYDLIRPEPGESFLVVGDVSGKGVAASLLMSQLHAIFRSLADSALPVRELLARANRIFCGSTLASAYATLACSRLTSGGWLQLGNAGHCPPLVLRGDRVESLPATGLPLGLFSSGDYATWDLELSPGDLLLFYTDGLSEARGPDGREFGAERIGSRLQRGAGLSAVAVVKSLMDDLASFQGEAPQLDDLTILALRRVG